MTTTITGTYGSQNTKTDIYIYKDSYNYSWYCCDGSSNINLALTDDLTDGVNVEELQDVDCFTWSSKITSEEELQTAVEA